MRLAVIDNEDNVVVAWPAVKDAHADLADLLAENLYPGRFEKKKRATLAENIRTHLLALQQQTASR